MVGYKLQGDMSGNVGIKGGDYVLQMVAHQTHVWHFYYYPLQGAVWRIKRDHICKGAV